MKDFYKIITAVVAVAILALVAYHYLVTVPNNHQESLRIKAEQDCQTTLSHSNIASEDRDNFITNCMNKKLSLWK